jgi:branched-chain amino acid transport system substrate-binding protein
LAAVVMIALLVVGAAIIWPHVQPAAVAFTAPVTIGAQLPLSGDRAAVAFGESLQNAIELAVDDANTQAGAAGPTIKTRAIDGGQPPDSLTAQSSMRSFVNDDSVVGVVGPTWSATAFQDIPIGNVAGLLQCSPANTNAALTKPEFGGLVFRTAAPNRISYVRVIATDDMQGPAAASFVFTPPDPGSTNLGLPPTHGLGVEHALVIDDATKYGQGLADFFQSAFEAKGGVVDRRGHNPGTDDLGPTLALLGKSSDPAGAVYFGGDPDAALEVKTAMAAAGFAATPFVSSDALYGDQGAKPPWIEQAGSLAANTYITQAGVAPVDPDWQTRYRRVFGAAPSNYAAAAYACTQVIIAAIRDAIAHGADAAGLREAVRAAVVGAPQRTPTVIGDVGFDANGDSLDQYVTIYDVDPTAAGGKGDWAILDQQNFGTASPSD